MTAVWADMMFGRRDPWFATWTNTADIYLLFDIDLPWVDDGTRMFGSPAQRQRFFDLDVIQVQPPPDLRNHFIADVAEFVLRIHQHGDQRAALHGIMRDQLVNLGF